MGRYNGIVVFVGGVAPGDLVRARVTLKKSRLWEAELVEVLKPSAARRLPPCPVATRCGGCSWQHVDYDMQVEQKEKILRDSLRGLLKYGEWEWRSFVRAPDEFHYRNRIQVHFQKGNVGFFAKGTRDLVPIKECWIADPRLNEQLVHLEGADSTKVELALTEDGQVRVMANERDPEAAVFAQVNQAQNEILRQRLIDWVGQIPPDWMMDLYAGSGNLTFPLAQHFPETPLLAMELSRKAVERGQKKSQALKNLKWLAADVGPGLKQTPRSAGRGIVVLDPPRTGVSTQVCEEILRHSPQQIVYVSCNPTTFARDVEHWLRDSRYRLTKVQGLDMFPQTEHVELIASLCAAT